MKQFKEYFLIHLFCYALQFICDVSRVHSIIINLLINLVIYLVIYLWHTLTTAFVLVHARAA